MVSHHPQDGQPPSPEWSPTIPSMVTPSSQFLQKKVYYRPGIWHLDLTNKIKARWQLPWMVSPQYPGWFTYYLKNRLTPSKIYQKKVWHIDLTHKTETRWQMQCNVSLPRVVNQSPKYGHPPSAGWSATNTRMVTHNPLDGHPQFNGYPHFLRMLTNHWRLTPRLNAQSYNQFTSAMKGHLSPHGWSPSFQLMVTGPTQDGNPTSPGWSPSSKILWSNFPKIVTKLP